MHRSLYFIWKDYLLNAVPPSIYDKIVCIVSNHEYLGWLTSNSENIFFSIKRGNNKLNKHWISFIGILLIVMLYKKDISTEGVDCICFLILSILGFGYKCIWSKNGNLLQEASNSKYDSVYTDFYEKQ